MGEETSSVHCGGRCDTYMNDVHVCRVNGSLGIHDTSTTDTTGSVIELGAGSLKKTSVLLQALSDTVLSESILSSVNYYALDLELGQLVSTLDQLEKTIPDAVTTVINDHADQAEHTGEHGSIHAEEGVNNKIMARGICASYDDALPYLKQGKLDDTDTVHTERKNILFLGSSIGNYSREEGAEFLKKISDEAMRVGDTLLIGIDGCDDGPRIEKAYNDSLGVTRAFILNGVEHVSRILGDEIGLNKDQFEYANRYNSREGRHEAYLRVKEPFSISLPISEEDKTRKETVSFEKDELIAIERSYKYTPLEALRLFSSAGLRLVQRWTDDDNATTGNYNLYLLEKAPFHFPSTLETLEGEEKRNPFGLPTLGEWDRLWAAWDLVVRFTNSHLGFRNPVDVLVDVTGVLIDPFDDPKRFAPQQTYRLETYLSFLSGSYPRLLGYSTKCKACLLKACGTRR